MPRTIRSCSRWLLLAYLVAPGTQAQAQPARAPEPVPSTEKTTASCKQPTALGRTACELARQLPRPERATVVSLTLKGAPAESRTMAFSERLSAVVAGHLGFEDGGATESSARAQLRSRHHETLLLLTPELRGAELGVTADVFVAPRGFWARVKQPVAASVHHAFSAVRVDPEVQSFLPPVPLVATLTQAAELPFGDVQALACGDLDADGALEIAVLGRHRLIVGRVRGERFEAWGSKEWKELAPIAPAPLRQPLATLSLSEGRFLDLGSTDRAARVRLSTALERMHDEPGALPWPGLGCVARVGLGLAPEPEPCREGNDAPAGATSRVLDPTLAVDTVASARIRNLDGEDTRVWAFRPLGQPQLNVRGEAGHHAVIDGAGALAALGDLNLDGRVEIVTSNDTLDPTKDALRVYTWQPPAKPTLAFELAVANGVSAATVCPTEGNGLAPLVLSTGSQLWVVR